MYSTGLFAFTVLYCLGLSAILVAEIIAVHERITKHTADAPGCWYHPMGLVVVALVMIFWPVAGLVAIVAWQLGYLHE